MSCRMCRSRSSGLENCADCRSRCMSARSISAWCGCCAAAHAGT